MDTVNYRRHKVYNIRKTVIVVLRHCIISLLALFFLLPIIVLLTRSVMSPDDIYQVPTLLFPTKLDFSGYTKAFDDQILSYLWNTIIVVGVNTVFVPLTCLMCGYGFTKVRFPRSWNLFFIVIKHNHDSRDRYANSALYRLLSSWPY